MPGEPPELSLEEMLADPIVGLVMRRDGLVAADVRLIMSVARAARLPLQLAVAAGQSAIAEALAPPLPG
jgi:hypothetical protein